MIVITCDCGCGASSENQSDFETFGFAKKVQYCAGCSEEIKNYQESVDALHTEMSQKWEKGLKNLRKEFLSKHPNAKLPDA